MSRISKSDASRPANPIYVLVTKSGELTGQEQTMSDVQAACFNDKRKQQGETTLWVRKDKYATNESIGHYTAYQNGRREMKLTVKSAIEPLIKYDRRKISEMETYARTLTQEQLVTLAMAMQNIINGIEHEIERTQ